MLGFFIEFGNLKKLKRIGWVLRGVLNLESIVDYFFRVVLIIFFLVDEFKKRGVEINFDKVV